MGKSKARRLARRLAAKRRRWNHPVLARSQEHLSDREIDAALVRAGLERADLFTPGNAIARHRVRMAHMLLAFEIDPERAVREHWEALKQADGHCSRCAQVGRCRRWLEWGGRNGAPQVFCPNAALFAAIAAGQARREIGRHLGG